MTNIFKNKFNKKTILVWWVDLVEKNNFVLLFKKKKNT